jgi:hypothetical protein
VAVAALAARSGVRWDDDRDDDCGGGLMWTAIARSGLALVVLTFMMWVLVEILTPIIGFATSGPNADAESVARVGSYFNALTLDNLVLIAALGVGITLLARAAVERRIAR